MEKHSCLRSPQFERRPATGEDTHLQKEEVLEAIRAGRVLQESGRMHLAEADPQAERLLSYWMCSLFVEDTACSPATAMTSSFRKTSWPTSVSGWPFSGDTFPELGWQCGQRKVGMEAPIQGPCPVKSGLWRFFPCEGPPILIVVFTHESMLKHRLGRKGGSGLKRQVVAKPLARFYDGAPMKAIVQRSAAIVTFVGLLGLTLSNSATPACRTLWRPAGRRTTPQDLGPTGRPGTARRRSQQPGRLLPHQPLGPRRLALALARVHHRLPQGTQQRSDLPDLPDAG